MCATHVCISQNGCFYDFLKFGFFMSGAIRLELDVTLVYCPFVLFMLIGMRRRLLLPISPDLMV